MKIAGTSATRDGGGERRRLIETDSTSHTDVDRGLFDKLPLESRVVIAEFAGDAGVAGNRRGFEWSVSGLGDHASNSFSVDGQPITDQQSKVFSNQIPVDSVQSMEVIRVRRRPNMATRRAW